MPRWTRLAIGWVVAAALAVGLSWTAVAQVRSRVIRPSIAISATTFAPVSGSAAGSMSTTAIRLEPGSSTAAPQTTAATTTTLPAPTVSTTTPPSHVTTTAAANSTTTPTTTAALSTTTTTPSSTTTTSTTAAPAQTTTTTTVAPAQTTSYQLTGGVVTISYSPGVVMFISAIPQPGFSTDIRESGPAEVRVRFDSSDHTSDFRARWSEDQLEVIKDEHG